MDHAAAQPADPLQRERHVGHGEYGSDAVSPGPGPRAWIPTAGPSPRV
jgi:hypothetical protein